MPLLGAAVLIIQVCFAWHALKSGKRNWVFIILAAPVMGCVLYYFMEVFPASPESRKAQKAARAFAKALDPDRALRERLADVEACGSVENRMQLARECMTERMYPEAATLFRSCLNGVYETDPELRQGLAAALAGDGRHEEALTVAQRLRASHPNFHASDVGLMIARALEELGRLEEALAELRVLADTYPGEEGRWRYGSLLRRLGRDGDAQEVFKRMLRNAERQPFQYRDSQKSWLDLARQNTHA